MEANLKTSHVNRTTLALPERRLTLSTVISLSLIGISALGLLIGLTIAYLNFRTQLRAQLRQRLLDVISIAVLQQNGDEFLSIKSNLDPAYETIRLQNLKIRATDPDLRFVYTMRFDNKGLYFVVDATNPGEPGASAYGERYLKPGPVLATNFKTIDHPLVENDFYTDEYGSFLSAYAPFYTSHAQLAGIIAIDISAAKVLGQERQVLIQFVSIFFLLLPLVGFVGWLIGNRLAEPIKSLTATAKHFSEGDLSFRPIIRTNFYEIRVLREVFFSMSDQMQSLVTNLEQRITERTQSLEHRSAEIQTASLIARETAAAPDLDSLLDRAAQLIMEKFSYYHTGIYLVDDNGEYVVLRAAGGDAGQLMIKRKYKVKIGEPILVGYVAKTGTSQVILDVASDSTYDKNPLLPYTRAEMALPLKVKDRIIGVLDIQSDKTNPFDQNSISIMQILTDQINTSIEKAQLLQGLQQNAVELQQALRENTSRTWQNFLEQNRGLTGYRYDGTTFEHLSELPVISTKNEIGNPINTLAVPIRLRGQTLGILNLQFQSTEIPQETLELVEEAANRLALALENARLVQDAQRLAMRERQINVISAQVQQSTNLETLLQNTVRELGNALGMPKTFIQIGLVNPGTKTDQ